MKLLTIILLLSLAFINTNAQNYEKIMIDKTDNLYGYYLAVKPQSNHIQGVLVLLPGFGSPAESVFPDTRLHGVGYENDILTIAISTAQKLYVDEAVSNGLDKILKDVVTRFGVEPNKFVIAGFSAGGTTSLRYTEMCKHQPAKHPIQPAGVVSVDGPVDLIDSYGYFEREIKRNFSKPGYDEAVAVKAMMDKELGTLKDNRQAYLGLTPFCMDLDHPGNEQYLKSTAVRVYHDIDPVWMLQVKRRSLRDMNAFASTEMINRLLQQGNDKAEFVPGKTGYRNDGSRHPHAWAIVDEAELIQWIRKTLEFFPEHAPEPYKLPVSGWNTEKEPFPIPFATTIPYKGIVDIRFTNGWGIANDPEYFSYCFLWYMDGTIDFTESSLQRDFETYYNGLNTGATNTVTNAIVKKAKASPGYEQTFDCTINTFDKFIKQKPVTLHCQVNLKKCTTANKTIAFFTVSPSDLNSEVWKKFNTIRDGVECTK